MPQVFAKSWTPVGRIIAVGALLSVVTGAPAISIIARSGYLTGANVAYDQPAPFSHFHHVGQLGIDCRYCHTGVETSGYAGIPPTKTCMNCHQQMWSGTDMLAVVRESYKKEESIPWQKVHNLPGFVYFNHSIHLAKGIGCVSCHGRLDEMHLTYQKNTLLMEWCLECHRNPEKHVRPQAEVFSMTWKRGDDSINPETGAKYTAEETDPKALVQKYGIRASEVITACSICHR